MKRRIVIRNLVLLSAGAAVLDACGPGEAAVTYRNIPLTDGQQDWLSELSEFIIPKTPDFIGAKDVHADEFALMMVDDCGTPEEQAGFLDGLQKFDEACMAKTSSKFIDATKEQRTAFLNALEVREGNDQPENVVKFYRGIKRLTIQSFTSSEQYLTQVRKYSLIPPKFQGCVPVETV